VGALSISIGEIGPGKNAKGQQVPGRGPFVEIGFGIPLAWGLVPSSWLAHVPERWRSGPMLGGAVSYYSPLLRVITRPMERPAAWLDRQGKRTTGWIGRRGKQVIGVVFRRGRAGMEEPASPREAEKGARPAPRQAAKR